MANPEHLKILKKGVGVWNEWREENFDLKPDLLEAELIATNLNGASLCHAELSLANFIGAKLINANLTKANLERSQLIQTILIQANLTGCHIFGISAWDLELEGANQTNLQITREGKPAIMVDNLEVAQFIYLKKSETLSTPLLRNQY